MENVAFVKKEITEREIKFIRKVNYKNFLLALFILPFILFFRMIPILILTYIAFYLSDFEYDNLLIKYIYGVLIISSIFSLAELFKREIALYCKKIYEITKNFVIVKKETGTTLGSGDSVTDIGNRYYKIILKNEKELIIDVEYPQYKEIEIGENFTLVYYNIVDIPIKGVYRGKDLKINSLKKRKKVFLEK